MPVETDQNFWIDLTVDKYLVKTLLNAGDAKYTCVPASTRVCTRTLARTHAYTTHTRTHTHIHTHTHTHTLTHKHEHTYMHTQANTCTHTYTSTPLRPCEYYQWPCNTLQDTATHCNTLQCIAVHCNTRHHTDTPTASRPPRQHSATLCNTLHHTDTPTASRPPQSPTRMLLVRSVLLWDAATLCNTLQHTAAHCSTLQHTVPHEHTDSIEATTVSNTNAVRDVSVVMRCRYTLQHSATPCNTLQHPATPCNTLQHPATHCSTQHQTIPHEHTDSIKAAAVTNTNTVGEVIVVDEMPQHIAALFLYPCAAVHAHCCDNGLHTHTPKHTPELSLALNVSLPHFPVMPLSSMAVRTCPLPACLPVTYQWVMSHINESCHISMNHITYQWVMSHINESCHISMSHVTYQWVMSHINESYHISMSHVTYQWVMSHINESCHISMSHVTYQWVMSHMNESCHIW